MLHTDLKEKQVLGRCVRNDQTLFCVACMSFAVSSFSFILFRLLFSGCGRSHFMGTYQNMETSYEATCTCQPTLDAKLQSWAHYTTFLSYWPPLQLWGHQWRFLVFKIQLANVIKWSIIMHPDNERCHGNSLHPGWRVTDVLKSSLFRSDSPPPHQFIRINSSCSVS